MVTFERVTWTDVLEIVATELTAPPSITVVLAPEPTTVKLLPIVRFSVYVAGATIIESPESASAMACLIVLQAVVADKQLLLSLPLTPLTYQVVLARAVGTTANNISATTHVSFLDFTVSSLSVWESLARRRIEGYGQERAAPNLRPKDAAPNSICQCETS